MTTKVLKFQSDQAGPFDVQNNKVDIVIPGYIGYSDLSRSCIIIDLKLKNKTNNNDVGLVDQSFAPNLDVSSLIKTFGPLILTGITGDSQTANSLMPILNIMTSSGIFDRKDPPPPPQRPAPPRAAAPSARRSRSPATGSSSARSTSRA